jgi:hypothetical protein
LQKIKDKKFAFRINGNDLDKIRIRAKKAKMKPMISLRCVTGLMSFTRRIQAKKCALSKGRRPGAVKSLADGRHTVTALSSLFKRLYEDNVLGRITNEQFRLLSADYNAEQKNLREAIPANEARLEKLKDSASNVEAFIGKAKKYTEINELTSEILRLFISRIEVGERDMKNSHSATRNIRIIYRDVGIMDSVEQITEKENIA